MLSPLDIENKVFAKSMRGYNCEEVDEFLDRIIIDMQTLLAENKKQQMQLEELNMEIKKAKESETSIKNTIDSVKKLMNDISESAEKRAEAIVKNAYLDAEIIKRNAKEEVKRLDIDNQRMQQKLQNFKERYTHFLQEELQAVDSRSADLLSELEFDMTPVPEEIKIKEKPKDDIKELFNAPAASKRDTIVVNEKSIEEMLMEDFSKMDKPATMKKTGDETIIK